MWCLRGVCGGLGCDLVKTIAYMANSSGSVIYMVVPTKIAQPLHESGLALIDWACIDCACLGMSWDEHQDCQMFFLGVCPTKEIM